MIRELIENKMRGMIQLNDDFETEQAVFDYYFNSRHEDHMLPDNVGFICVMLLDDCAYIPFAWHDGSFKARRMMAVLGRVIHKRYTIDQKLPIYYTGKCNYFKQHSEETYPNTWQFML